MSNRASLSVGRDAEGTDYTRGPLRQASRVSGSVETVDGHEHSDNDHFALVYEDRDEQFDAVIPFIRQGLDGGERCLYIADENTREEVLEVMRSRGIGVDGALESGALSILSPEDAYLNTGEFEPGAMVELWKDALQEAKEGAYTGIRAAAEMTWALESDTSADRLVEYEAMLNPLYQNEDYVVLCQYNRERFPPETIHDVIKTHPRIISDGTVSRNFYYTPPEKFFGSETTDEKVDRMIQTLQERTEMRSGLKRRQEYLERIFESSHDAIIIVDPEADEIVDANSAATEMLGYTYTELMTLGPSDIHPDELDKFREFVEDVYKNDTGWVDELPCRTKDRGQIPAEISASRLDHEGRSVLLAVVRDLSERRKWERAQRSLYEITADPDRNFDEKIEAIFDLGCEYFDLDLGGIAEVDAETDLFRVETMSGDHDHLVPGEEYPLSETFCRVVTGTGETGAITDPVDQGFEGNLCYERFGVQAYLGAYLELDDGGGRTFFFLSNQPRESEFTEAEHTFHKLMGQWVKQELDRQRHELELRARTEHLSALVETAPDCIKTVAADGTILQMNQAGLDLAGVDSESAVVGNCVYDFVVEEDRERYREFNERICSGESGTLEFDIVGVGGTRRHLETHAAPLRRPDGEFVQLALTRDVTEQIEREEELEHLVERLEASNDRLKQFAYAASHDLQEPLRMVLSYLQLLENDYANDLDEDAREHIDIAVEGASRMRELVDDLLAYSRVEQADGRSDTVDCRSVIDRVRSGLAVQIEENDPEIVAKSLPRVTGDDEQLEQLFSNLVSNALKYNDSETPRVEITATEGPDAWEFAVADNGIGIDSGKQDRIFEVFKRLHHDEEYPGTGIGLSLCQEIVANHGGEIWVESARGEGTTFYFTIAKR